MTPAGRPRFGALDLLRGVTVAGMIVVNNPGNWNSVFPQLTHAAWNGVTVADVIFPAFIFIMGVAMSLALGTSSTASKAQSYRRVFRRAVLLVLLGLVLNATAAWPNPGTMRIPGVLQRIGLTYLAAAAIAMNTDGAQQVAVAAGLLLLHWAVLVIPFGGAATGQLEPGHNIAASIDQALFGSHLLTPAGDPEGALGLLSCVATALLGAAVGCWVRAAANSSAAARSWNQWVFSKLTLVATGAIVASAAWARVLPLNKALWTPSFAALTAAVTTLCLVAAALLDGAQGSRALAPFAWLGVNPLAIYFLSELTTNVMQRPWLAVGGQQVALKDWFFWSVLVPRVGDNGGDWSSLVYALLYTSFWICVAGGMRWKGLTLRV